MREMERDPLDLHRLGSVFSADLASLLLLLAFVIFMLGVDRIAAPALSDSGLVAVGVAMSLVPALIWLAFFYRRDRLEPEPKPLVAQIFLLGAILAAAVGEPVLENVFEVDSWIYDNQWAYLLGSILVIGFVQEFVKYAAVRFTIFNALEFDELTDGIIYTTAAGLGYATYLNIRFIVDSGGANLALASVEIVLTALAHASFAGVVGYYLGRERFTNTPLWWTPFGVALAALLNGLFFSLRSAALQGGSTMGANPFNVFLGLLMAGVLAVVVTLILAYLIRRDVGILMRTRGAREEVPDAN